MPVPERCGKDRVLISTTRPLHAGIHVGAVFGAGSVARGQGVCPNLIMAGSGERLGERYGDSSIGFIGRPRGIYNDRWGVFGESYSGLVDRRVGRIVSSLTSRPPFVLEPEGKGRKSKIIHEV
jgi:hypothetical protein